MGAVGGGQAMVTGRIWQAGIPPRVEDLAITAGENMAQTMGCQAICPVFAGFQAASICMYPGFSVVASHHPLASNRPGVGDGGRDLIAPYFTYGHVRAGLCGFCCKHVS